MTSIVLTLGYILADSLEVNFRNMSKSPYEQLEEEIKRIPIEDIIADYISLKREGSGYTSLCPFHNEKTPSFKVAPHKGIWKCFGCGKGGDAIQFVAEYENISRKEAMLKIAEKYNLAIPAELKKREIDKTTLALEKLLTFYREQLLKSQEAKNYLRNERKLSSKTIEEFEIGFAPKGDEAIKFAKKEGIYEELVKIGHFKESYNSAFDIFRGRVIIPIRDERGKLVGFTGRAIDKDAKIKYLHAPYLKKSEILFGLDKALKDGYLNQKKFLILTEGVFDVIRMHELGFRMTVAVLGAGLSQKQIEKIRNLYKRDIIVKILFAYDNDEAGKKAVVKDWDSLYKEGVVGLYLLSPKKEVKDLDELGQVESYAKLKERIKKSLKASNSLPYLFAKKVNLLSEPEKIERAIKTLKETIFSIPDKTVAKNIWQKVKHYLHHKDIGRKVLKGKKLPSFATSEVDFVKHASQVIKAVYEKGWLSEPEYEIFREILPIDEVEVSEDYRKLSDTILKSLYNYILSVYEKGIISLKQENKEIIDVSFEIDSLSKKAIKTHLKRKFKI